MVEMEIEFMANVNSYGKEIEGQSIAFIKPDQEEMDEEKNDMRIDIS